MCRKKREIEREPREKRKDERQGKEREIKSMALKEKQKVRQRETDSRRGRGLKRDTEVSGREGREGACVQVCRGGVGGRGRECR